MGMGENFYQSPGGNSSQPSESLPPENIERRTVQASEYFVRALEAQRSINSHIHEIEPTTPVFLFEIDLNEIKPATVSYPNRNGPIQDGIIRIHNDFNLFNINRGIIRWRGREFYPFPIYGEQFDITSNGTIPTPKIKFSSQFLDDEFNSFYKYIRMQINELKDIVGSKVTRRKTFVRYLSPDNFAGGVNPFNTFTDTPWASRDGEVLTVRSLVRPPIGFAKWLVYTIKSNPTTNKVFVCLKTDDKLKTLDVNLQKLNYHISSLDHFNLFINDDINNNPNVIDSFSSDVFIIPGKNTYTNIISDSNNDFKKVNTNNKIKILCSSTTSNFSNSSNTGINYPLTFSENASELTTFLSFRSLDETIAEKFNYSISSQNTSGFVTSFSKPLNGNFDINYLTIPTGVYTGVSIESNENANLSVLKLSIDFGSVISGEYNILYNINLNDNPKILFNSWGSTGFAYNQYLKNINSTGCTFVATHTGDNAQLGIQNINLLATDYITDELSSPSSAQIYTAYHNMARDYLDKIDNNKIDIYEVELTPDIYYIDRKVQEDSQNSVYELASLLDIEGIKLPGRLLLSKNCSFSYRGEGCVYERKDRLTEIHSGVYGQVSRVIYANPDPSGNGITIRGLSDSQKCLGLESAPPIADSLDQNFAKYQNVSASLTGVGFRDEGSWKQGVSYYYGNYIFVEKNLIKYYFICKQNHVSNSINAPPNSNYWESDTCSKSLVGCRLRWKENSNFELKTIKIKNFNEDLLTFEVQAPKDADGNQLIGILPFGGFPSVEGKFQSQQGPQGNT